MGAQTRQAVWSGISLHATRPSQPISLGTFEPFHDMTIFGLSEKNKFKIPFSLGSGYSLLDNLMGKGWDVKSLRGDVADCHFKFVTLLTVYLDKNKTLLLSFHFHIPRLLFLLARITAKSARHYPSDVNMQVHI